MQDVASGDRTADLPVRPSAMGNTPPTIAVVNAMGRRRFELRQYCVAHGKASLLGRVGKLTAQ